MKMKTNFKEPIPLSRLEAGQRGRVCEPSVGEQIPQRLQDLGFVPGTWLEIRRRAPLGDPVEIELRGYRLCLRTAQLDSVRVEVGLGVEVTTG